LRIAPKTIEIDVSARKCEYMSRHRRSRREKFGIGSRDAHLYLVRDGATEVPR
jgi:hypothetical protein